MSAWAAIPLHVKKLAVMVNGTTCAKKLRWNIRNGNRYIYIALLQTIDIESNMTILIYKNTVNMPIRQYSYKQRYRMPYSFRVVP